MSDKSKQKPVEEQKQDVVSSISSKIDLEKIKQFDITNKIPFLDSLFAKRACAAFVDVLLLCVVVAITSLASSAMFDTLGSCILAFIIHLAAAALIALKDAPYLSIFNYKSPGKAFIGLSIMDMNRNRITPIMSVKRNLCFSAIFVVNGIVVLSHAFTGSIVISLALGVIHLIPLIWILYEAFKLYKSPDNRRPGDQLAGTTVELF